MKQCFMLVLLSYLLAACGAEPTPTPDLVATHLAVDRAAVATSTAPAPTPTNTPKPTSTPKPTPLPTWTRRSTRTPSSLHDLEQQTPVAASGPGDSDLSRLELVIQRLQVTPAGLILGGLGGLLLGVILMRAWFRRRAPRTGATAREVESQYRAQIGRLQSKHWAEINELRSNYTPQPDQTREEHQREITSLKEVHQAQLQELDKERQAEIQRLTAEAPLLYERQRLQAWFETLRQSPWSEHASEVEIEAKFVFQLLRFLGYPEHEIEMRTPIPVQHGTSETTVKADFVIRSSDHGVLLVVEAKAPDRPLTDTARRQARSYAFQLGAPLYMVTNGHELLIYLLGVLEDERLLSCNTSQLEKHWKSVAEAASRSSVVALRNRLGRPRGKNTGG